jgi:predicted flap endonuclease-1-like 5' DNA nuclease
MLALVLLSEEGPKTDLSWLVIVALGFFLLMIIIGWLVSRNKPEAPAVETHAHDEHDRGHAEKTTDDLKSLEGIGPKVQKVLNEAGIHTFADLAGAEAAKVQDVLDKAGMQYMNPAGWISQAKLAAAGDMDGLARLQDELKGGRAA